MILHYESDPESAPCESSPSHTALSIIDVIELNYGNVLHLGRIDKLVSRLQEGRYNIMGGVLVFGQEYELIELFKHKTLLDDLYLMIVLLQDHPRMLSLALQLRPRYFAVWEKNKMEILKTLKNFLKSAQKRSMLTGRNATDAVETREAHRSIKGEFYSIIFGKKGK